MWSYCLISNTKCTTECGIPDSKVPETNMGPNWSRQDPDGPHVGPMNLVIWDIIYIRENKMCSAPTHPLTSDRQAQKPR